VKLAAVVAVLALAACQRFEQQGPPPSYHDSKLDVMRVVGEPAPAADAAPASAPKAGP